MTEMFADFVAVRCEEANVSELVFHQIARQNKKVVL